MPNQQPPAICPVCKEASNFDFIQDYKNEWGEWSLYECSKCRVQFWLPFKAPGIDFYEFLEGYLVRDIAKPVLSRVYHKKFLNYYKNSSPEKIKILDLGCGMGDFIARLKKIGYDVWGVDFNRNSIKFIKENFKLDNVYALSFEQFFNLPNLPKFDVITFFEVIEHIDNPLQFIQQVKNLLKEEGLMILSTPSRERMLVNSLSSDFPPHHLSRWSEESIAKLFAKINFKISRIEYIEQYKFILDSLTGKFRTGLVAKTVKITKNQEGENERIVAESTLLTHIVHIGAYLKDFLIGGIPAAILFLIGKLKGTKNGGMLICLKRKT